MLVGFIFWILSTLISLLCLAFVVLLLTVFVVAILRTLRSTGGGSN